MHGLQLHQFPISYPAWPGLRQGTVKLWGRLDLRIAIGTDPPYATLITNKLQGSGLVSRGRDPDDRRRKRVELTAAGRAAVKAAEEIITRPPPAMREMREDDLLRLREILEELRGSGRRSAATPEAES